MRYWQRLFHNSAGWQGVALYMLNISFQLNPENLVRCSRLFQLPGRQPIICKRKSSVETQTLVISLFPATSASSLVIQTLHKDVACETITTHSKKCIPNCTLDKTEASIGRREMSSPKSNPYIIVRT